MFLAFHFGVFSKMARKHIERIRSYGDVPKSIFAFLDAKGYVIMAVMMGGGAALRMSGALPAWFFAFFYTGLGAALALAGLRAVACYAQAVCDCGATSATN